MKKLTLLFAVVVIMAGFATRVMAQGATVAGVAAGAKIITPITLANTGGVGLNFGTMSVTAVPGTCVLLTDGSRTTTGGVNISAVAPLATNATFTVGGEPSVTYLVTFPTGATITVTKAVTLETMSIGSLTVLCTSTGADGTTGTLSGAGADAFVVGGTLTVAGSQVAGVYSGTFSVNVDYN